MNLSMSDNIDVLIWLALFFISLFKLDDKPHPGISTFIKIYLIKIVFFLNICCWLKHCAYWCFAQKPAASVGVPIDIDTEPVASVNVLYYFY